MDDRREALRKLDGLLYGSHLLRNPPSRPHVLLGPYRGATPAVLALLRVLGGSESGPTVGDLARAVEVDASTASRTVERGAELDLVERRPCPEDGRRARVFLTMAGREVVAEDALNRLAILATVTQSWNQEDLDKLVLLLGRLRRGFETVEASSRTA